MPLRPARIARMTSAGLAALASLSFPFKTAGAVGEHESVMNSQDFRCHRLDVILPHATLGCP